MVYKAIDIAHKLIAMAQRDEANGGELLTNLKLQKLLYYQQGFHLANFGTPLFKEDIEAWMYGPVVPCIYDHFREYGAADVVMSFPSAWRTTSVSSDSSALIPNVDLMYSLFRAGEKAWLIGGSWQASPMNKNLPLLS